MSRPKNAIPGYKFHKPSGQAVMRVTLPGGLRKSVYLGVFGSPESKAEYARRVQALGTSIPTAVTAPSVTDLTVAELLVQFLEHADRHYRGADGKPTSSIWAFKLVAKPMKELFAYLPVGEFGPNALKSLRARTVELGWCRKTVNAAVTSVRTIFKWGVSEELVPAELLARLASVAGLQRGRSEAPDPEPVAPVTDAHMQAVIPLVPRGVRGLILFQRFTGARPGEAVVLRMKDINTSGATWMYTPAAHKNTWRGKRRTIAIGPRGKQLLEEFATADPNAPVFPTGEGTAYTVSGYRQAIERACLKAKIEVWSPNQLRHTFATEARRLFGLEGAQVALGHSKADTTQIYAERDNTLSAKVASQIG
ncbi:site-specific integrase [Gemmata sp. G18]|uniref:Site-specific integrase n=1 Tax=Gemmata palustris TaxID=2822762 RepID=A0ABS5BMZ5_9BACT|nr:site-specific integrase [Gemmata palustris]MBP3955058.1 site-specific integrase [Gemmata palustris]